MPKTISLATAVNRSATPNDALDFVVHSTPNELRNAVKNRKITRNRLLDMAVVAVADPLPKDTAPILAEKIISALRPVVMHSPLAPHSTWKDDQIATGVHDGQYEVAHAG